MERGQGSELAPRGRRFLVKVHCFRPFIRRADEFFPLQRGDSQGADVVQIGAFGENDRRVSSCQGDPEDGLAAAEGDSCAAHSHSRAREAEL